MNSHVPKGFKAWQEYYKWRNIIDMGGLCMLIAITIVFAIVLICK